MNQFLIALLILLGCLGICAGFKYFKTKSMVSEQDLDNVITVFGLTSKIAIQMNLANEPKIKQISDIVMNSLVYCKKTYNEKDLYENTKAYVLQLCSISEITLNEKQSSIVNQLILIALNTGII